MSLEDRSLSPDFDSTNHPLYAELSKQTKQQLIEQLKAEGADITGNKAELVERLFMLKMSKTQPGASRPTSSSNVASGDIAMMFNLFHEQQSLQEKRFLKQMEQFQSLVKQESEFNSQQILQSKAARKHSHLKNALQTLQQKREQCESLHEVEVLINLVEKSLHDFEELVDANVDLIVDSSFKEEILQKHNEVQLQYLNQLALAKAYVHNIKAKSEQDRLAGCLPVGVTPPSFDGNALKFPTFWDAFVPLIYENPKVSKFYKMNYLKSAMRGAAADVLNSYPLTASSYDSAVTAILKRYGKKQIIIRNHLEDLLKGQRIDNDAKQLQALTDRVAAKKAILTDHGVTWDQLFVQIVENQLSRPLKEKWVRKLCPMIENDEVPDSEKLLNFLLSELAAMELLSGDKANAQKKGKTPYRDGSRFQKHLLKKESEWPASASALVAQTTSFNCLFCSDKHELTKCSKFLDLSPAQRLAELVCHPGKVCFKCLQFKGSDWHPSTFRKCTAKCNIKGCQKSHHSLLHVDTTKPSNKVNAIVSTAHCVTSIPSHLSEESKFCDKDIETILPTALAKIKVKDKEKIIHIGFDSFSQKTFLTKDIVDELQIAVTHTDVLNVSGFGGISTTESMDVVKFVLTPIKENSQEKMHIEAHVKSGKICSPLDPLDIDINSVPYLQNLTLADQVPRNEVKIDLLLGSRYYFRLLNGRVIGPGEAETGPLAIESPFGWALAGPLHKRTLQRNTTSNKCLLLTASDRAEQSEGSLAKLDGLLQNFWQQEAIGLIDSDCVYTQDERSAVTQFEKFVSFDGTRYCVALPFCDNAPELCSNYNEAKMRLYSTEKSLNRNPEKLKAYNEAIIDYVKNGFAHELTELELKNLCDEPKYFVPHHPVFKETSTSTKIRIVFDASAKYCNGNSLNDCLLKGPNLLPDIAAVLLRFRMHRIALNGDLQKMFCQTAVTKDHQRYQLYLWRNCDTFVEPKVYAMERLMFGVTSSPFLAIQSVLKHASSTAITSLFGKTLFQLLKANMYMDDVHIGGATVAEVVQMQRDLVDFFKSGGWTLIKFASNSDEVLNQIPKDARLPNMVLNLDSCKFGEASSLGLKWDTQNDLFYCKVTPKLLRFDKVITKCSILSKVSQIYDLFGFLAAYTIRAKILIQKLWKRNVAWNEKLHCDIAREYVQWVTELSKLETVKIPRCPFSGLGTIAEIELHGFCDSSTSAYAAVVYLRFTDVDGQVMVSYIMAKTRVAPVKQTSVPRLELMAAHSLAKLASYVLKAVKPVVCVDRVCLWTDSTIVLAWISKPSYHWKMFVKNRVQEIHDTFPANVWRHCPGMQNPADMHSRGMKLNDLLNCDVYWHGPDWLKSAESHWPSNSEVLFDYSTVDCLNKTAKFKETLVTVIQKHLGRDIFEPFF